jgi:branched-chain amino acid transport system permease protein
MFDRLARHPGVRSTLPVLGAMLIVLAVPSIVTGAFWQQVLTIALLNVALAMSLNLVVGYTGLLALGHGAFFGVGAYTSAILMTTHDWGFWTAFCVGGVAAGVCGSVLAAFTLRLRGHYLAIATLGFAVIVYSTLMTWISVTRGPQGIPGIPGPPDIPLGGGFVFDFGLKASYLYLAGVFAILCYLLFRRIIRSPVGDALTAIREDEVSALSLGIRTFWWKSFSLTVSAVVAGLTGALYAGYVGILEPSTFILTVSFTLLAMVIVGGAGTLLGPVIGALVLSVVPEALRGVGPEYRLILYGLALTLTVLFFPQGLAGIGSTMRSKLWPNGGGRASHPPPPPTAEKTQEVSVDAP